MVLRPPWDPYRRADKFEEEDKQREKKDRKKKMHDEITIEDGKSKASVLDIALMRKEQRDSCVSFYLEKSQKLIGRCKLSDATRTQVIYFKLA